MPVRKKQSNIYLFIILLIIIIGLIVAICVITYPNIKTSDSVQLQNSTQVEDSIKTDTTKESNSVVINNIYPRGRKSLLEDQAYERVFNPLLYPYKSPPFYKQGYNDLRLPPQVIGCGSRRTPCMGGSQVAITNNMPRLIIDDSNIAPVNISTQGPIGEPQQVGAIYKVFGNENQVYPLFGRRKYPNDNKWEYYTTIGQYGVKMPVVTPRKNDELGTNETVFIRGQKTPYRVSMYETDHPQYIPYA